MKVIKTQPISPSDIVSSTIPEDRVFEWVSGASYGVATSFTSNPDDYKNLVQKSNFQDGNVGSWGIVSSGDFVTCTSRVHKELRVNGTYSYLDSSFSVTPGETLYISVKINSEFSPLGGVFGISKTPSSVAPTGISFDPGTPSKDGSLTGSIVVPAGTTTAYATIAIPSFTGIARPLFVSFRDLKIYRAASPSVNLVSKPSFDDGSLGLWVGSGILSVKDSLSYYSGESSGCLSPLVGSQEYVEAGNRFDVYPGETLYFSSEFSGLTDSPYVGVKFFTKSGSYISSSTVSGTTQYDLWSRISGSAVVPPNADKATPLFYIGYTTTKVNNLYVGRFPYAANGPLFKREAIRQTFMATTAGTLTVAPELNPTNWTPVGVTNSWAAFDREPNTRSVGYGSLSVKLRLNGSDSIALHGVKCTGLTISAANSANTVIYGPKTLNPYSVTLTDLPADSANNTVTVTLTGTGQVSLGLVDIGTAVDLGGTDYGATFTIVDYSRKEVDEFGTASFVKRGFAKKISAKSMFANTELNKITSTLSELRSTPCSWSITDEVGLETMNIFGWYEDLDINVPYPKHSYCSVNIQGLIE